MAKKGKRYDRFGSVEPIWGMALRLNGTNQGTDEEREELAQLLSELPLTDEEIWETEGMAIHMQERNEWYRAELKAGRVPAEAAGIIERMEEDYARIDGLLNGLKALKALREIRNGGEPVWND